MDRQKLENIIKTILQGESGNGFEWIEYLSPKHLQLFRSELEQVLQQDTPTENLIELLESWEATAELDMAPEVAKYLKRE